MTRPKARIFAGPNGSGKTTLFEHLTRRNIISPIRFINADLIEAEIRKKGFLALDQFSPAIDSRAWAKYFRVAGLDFSGGVATPRGVPDSYMAAAVAEGLRNFFIDSGVSFAAETVFSHESKLRLLKNCQTHGFDVYFYFIATDSPTINLRRVAERTAKGGHDVPQEKIVERYKKSIALLPKALRFCRRAFVFDNSGDTIEFIAEYESGKGLCFKNGVSVNWFDRTFKK